jgi:hypothetical protein
MMMTRHTPAAGSSAQSKTIPHQPKPNQRTRPPHLQDYEFALVFWILGRGLSGRHLDPFFLDALVLLAPIVHTASYRVLLPTKLSLVVWFELLYGPRLAVLVGGGGSSLHPEATKQNK